MAKIEIYTKAGCQHSRMAKRLFEYKGLAYQEYDTSVHSEYIHQLLSKTGAQTYPQIFINDHYIGGSDELHALNEQGTLAALLESRISINDLIDNDKDSAKMTPKMHITELYTYPVKSIKSIPQASAQVTLRGLAHDRLWMVVGQDDVVVTARECPKLLLISAVFDGHTLVLHIPDKTPIDIDIPDSDAQKKNIKIHNIHCDASIVESDVNESLSAYLERPVQLAFMRQEDQRMIADRHFGNGTQPVSFADSAPLLIISKASLNDLNHRLAEPVEMNRFRPNIVIDGCPAYAEDGFKQIQIGEVIFDALHLCTRCVLTTIDPLSAQKHPKAEPLKTLASYRMIEQPKGIAFGAYFVPRSAGKINQDDEVKILA